MVCRSVENESSNTYLSVKLKTAGTSLPNTRLTTTRQRCVNI